MGRYGTGRRATTALKLASDTRRRPALGASSRKTFFRSAFEPVKVVLAGESPLPFCVVESCPQEGERAVDRDHRESLPLGLFRAVLSKAGDRDLRKTGHGVDRRRTRRCRACAGSWSGRNNLSH